VTWPTPYPEVNIVLGEVLAGAKSIFGDQFVGMYMYGSLANGDFDRESDVDYVVVTDRPISDPQFAALDAMHQRIAEIDLWPATQLEGSYLPRGALRQFDPVRVLHVHIDRGPAERLRRMHIDDPILSRAWWGGWVILRENLSTRGVTVTGPAPQTLVEPVSPDELRQAAAAILPGWSKAILANAAEISGRAYQSYTVLTVCRILYTLEHGAVVSKRAAAVWAQEALDAQWRPLIERAWSGRQNPDLRAEAEDVNATLGLIRWALEPSLAEPDQARQENKP
jgi:aminoglycoside adenylyltransferase-like protein/nucleotidyltransferase-like protein